MDTTSVIVSSNVQAALSFSTVSIAVCSWEVIMNFKDRLLFWSMILAFLGQLVMNIGSSLAYRELAKDLDFPLHLSQSIRLTVADVLTTASLLFHSSYRTVLIMNPYGDHHWAIPLALTSVGVALHIAYNYLWERDIMVFQISFHTYVLGIAVMIYQSIAETVAFVLSQYTIITSLSMIQKFPLPWWLIVQAFLRSACFVSSVIMKYLSLGGYFFPGETAGPYIFQAGNLMILVMLSDSARIREIIEYFESQNRGGVPSELSTKIVESAPLRSPGLKTPVLSSQV
ncbi:hypothetical protein DFJ73DRAFT_824640 [Zopfochytrium polystomum]|nr:hypothetical protein DFJ73DRAFT_824640 [Zopfochytrium polystomum]